MPASRNVLWLAGAVLATSAIVLSTPIAAAVERHVPVEYATIQAAIEASADGDEVVIAPGTYTGEGNRDIDFNGKAITVRSTNPDDPEVVAATVIDCQGTATERHRGFKFRSGEGADSVIAGLTITHGCAPDETLGASTVPSGGAILCVGSSPTVANCVLAANSTERCHPLETVGPGGAIHCLDAGNATLVGCVFVANSARIGGAVAAVKSSPSVTDCLFNGNAASRQSGGAIYVSGNSAAPVVVTNCVFCGNGAEYYGGAMRVSRTAVSPVLTNCLFVGNGITNPYWPSADGGAIYLDMAYPIIALCTFSQNRVPVVPPDRAVGGIASVSSIPKITNCILWGDSLDEISSLPLMTYSDVAMTYHPGEGNINSDPLFPSGPTRTWTAPETYDAQKHQVTLTDSTATWLDGQLVGRFVNPDATQTFQFLVIANTATTVTIWEGLVLPAGLTGKSYRIYDYRLSQTAAGQASDSPCVNTGKGLASLHFITGSTRTDGVDDAGVVDMGYHYGARALSAARSDFDGDADVDLDDFLHFQGCINGPNRAPPAHTTCLDARLDADTDVDLADFMEFQDCFNGPNRPAKC